MLRLSRYRSLHIVRSCNAREARVNVSFGKTVPIFPVNFVLGNSIKDVLFQD